MPKSEGPRSSAAHLAAKCSAPSGAVDAKLSLLDYSPILRKLKASVSEGYASLSANQEGASEAIGKVVAVLARPDMPIDPHRKRELIAKCGELLTALDRLHSLLPQGEHQTLQSLEKLGKATELLHQLDGRTRN